MEKNDEEDQRIIKIAIVGSESTGKTTLAEQLAAFYETVWVPEYAREYLNSYKHNKYKLLDIEKIAQIQIKKEEEQIKIANKILFCDTNLLVSKIWAENAFGSCPEWILSEIEMRQYDFYLLANIDLPWIFDEQREHPHLREYFFNLYEKELRQRNLPYAIISGVGKARMYNAITVLKKQLLYSN